MTTPLADQIAAANAEVRGLLTTTMPGIELAKGEPPAWAAEMLDRHLTPTAPRCAHIAARPVQPTFLFAWEGHARCRSCVQAFALTQLAAGATLGDAEEGTCDRCREHVGADQLTTLVIRIDLWVLQGALCPPCSRGEGVKEWLPPRMVRKRKRRKR